MTEKEEKRIALRVDPETWHKWDDKRHSERTSFQELGTRLLSEWFAGGVPRVLPSTGAIRVVDTIHKDSLSDNLHESEREFLLECLRIYRSEFRRPLQENVTFFGIGLSAVEQIAAMGMNDERSIPNADALSPGEQRAFALADHAENEADLLKAATRDVVEKLRRPGIGDSAAIDGAKPRRKSGTGKAGGRGGD